MEPVVLFRLFLGFLLAFGFGFLDCAKPPGSSNSRDPYSLDTLVFLEETFLDIWEGEETRESAVAELRYACRNADTWDGFLCFSWGMVEYKRNNFEESFTAFEKALEKNPNDTLYKNMLRLAALSSGNENALRQKLPEGPSLVLYSKALSECDYSSFLELAKQQCVSLEQTRKGRFAECYAGFSDKQKSELNPHLQKRNLVYADILWKEKTKREPFTRVWDTGPYYKGLTHDEVETYEKPISESWRKFRAAAKSNNAESAKKHFQDFSRELQLIRKKGAFEANLALAIERSSKLLIEQDPTYQSVRFLSKE